MESGERSEEEEETQSSGGGEEAALETPLAAGTEGRVVGENGEEGDGSGSEEGETSDSASSNSSSTTTGSSSSSGVAARSPGGDGGALMQTDEYGDHFHVNCAGNAAKFYLNRFARGSIGRCVLFRSRWITPNEFQAISGRQSSKDWKRSIRLRGRCLKEYITQGLFQEHLKTCACQICSGEAAEHLRQEGEMALAAKRRRLSQADGGGGVMATGGHSSILSEGHSRDSTHSPTHFTARVGTKRKRGRGGKVHRVWSPSGEMAHEMSEDDEEEGEGGEGEGEEDSKDQLHRRTPSATAADTSLDFRRRSRRSAHRKHTGYRTELGTFTRRPREWDMEEVAEFLNLQGFGQFTQHFQEGEVDGESMFLLKEHHLVERFGLKLGPALKLMDTISRLRHPPA